MSKSVPFSLNRSALLLALISAAFAGAAGAAAGRVEFTAGGVTVSGTDGRERPLVRGTDLDNGDTVRTTDGRAQIRFTDGAYVSLQPNTEFAIKEYRFDGKADGNERGFFALAKGAMRTVTGLVGRVNRDRYRITTPTATVGIRGTGGRIEVLLDGSTLIAGTSGIWTLTNPSGTIDVPAGTFGKAPAAPNQPPQQTSQGPDTAPAPLPVDPPKPQEFTQGGEVDASGKAQGITTFKPLASGSGYEGVVMYSFSGGFPNFATGTSPSATFNANGQLTEIQNLSGQSFGIGSGSHADFGTDGVLAWGRWIGDTLTCGECSGPPNFPAVYNENQGLHYVVGMPTAVLPTSGTARYELAGSTRPTYTDGSTAPGSFAGSLNVVFGGTTRIDVDLRASMPQAGLPNRSYGMLGQISTTSSAFSSSSLQTTGCASQPCSSLVTGFFAGSGAERVGLGYHVTDGTSVNAKHVIGTAAFKKQ